MRPADFVVSAQSNDLLLDAQMIRDRFQAIGIVGHDHFRAEGFGQIANPLLGAEGRLRFHQIEGQGLAREEGGRHRENLILALALDMREIQTEDLDFAGLLLDPLLAQTDGALARGLHIFIDGGLAQKEAQALQEIADPLITEAQDVEQDAHALEGFGVVCLRHAGGIHAEGATTGETTIALGENLGVAGIAQRLGADELMRFEMAAGAFPFRMPGMGKRAAGGW